MPRTATDPVSRISPQVYRGEVVSECIDIAGRSSCKVADGSWKPCAASGAAVRQAGPAPAAPTGDAPELDDDDDDEVKSEDIQLILAMLQQLSEDTEDLHAKVDELQDAQEAEMSAQAVVSPAMPMSPGSDAGQPAPGAGGRWTLGGEACQFPVIYRGEPVSDCIDIAGKSSCKVADGSWKPCAASAATAPVRPITVDGEACILPAVSEIRTRRFSIAFPGRGRRTATD